MVRNPRARAITFAAGLALLIPLAWTARAAEGRWSKTYTEAQAQARKNNKRIMVEFYADWCGPCKMMAQTTLKNQEVVGLLDRFVPVRVNVDKEKGLARKYRVDSIPRAVILTADGKVVRESVGYSDAKQFSLFLKQGLP